MAQLLLRNIPEHLALAVKQGAQINGRSANDEAIALIEDGLRAKRDAWLAETEVLRAETRGRKVTPSEVLIREGRDSR